MIMAPASQTKKCFPEDFDVKLPNLLYGTFIIRFNVYGRIIINMGSKMAAIY